MCECACGLIFELGVLPMNDSEARAAIHRPCPVCSDRGANRYCWLAPLSSEVIVFPIKTERLQ